MDRRSFLRAAAVAPLAAVVTVLAALPGSASAITRVSTERGDPGEIAFGKLCADGKRAKTFLNGVEQKWCLTADASEGWVKRHIESDGGNCAYNAATGDLLTEIVHGHVEIRIV